MRRRWSRLRSLSWLQLRVVLSAIILLPLVRASVAVRGLKWTAGALTRCSPGPAQAAGADEARPIAEAVALVAGLPLVGGRCLPRSLVQWTLLRRRGIDALLVIGAAPPEADTFSAHAWVEVDGVPVADAEDVRASFGSFELRLPRLSSKAP